MGTGSIEQEWHISVEESAQVEIKKIRRGSAKQELFKQIKKKLQRAPLDFGEALRSPLYPARRLRVGNYRVVYVARGDTRTVHILAVRPRADVYEEDDVQNLIKENAREKKEADKTD